MRTLPHAARPVRAIGAGLPRLLAAGALLILTGCGVFYGPTTDRSGFVSARLLDDGRTAAFTYQRLVYSPARGIAAFPDGGVPQYREDRAIMGTCDVRTGAIRIFVSDRNREFQHGQGRLTILDAMGTRVLVARSGQARKGGRLLVRHLLIDTATGRIQTVDSAEALARRDRAPGIIRLVDTDGTLLFESPLLADARDDPAWSRNPAVIPELWARTPDGRYRKLASTRHYVTTDAGEAFYWDPDQRMHVAVELRTGDTRPAPEFRPKEPVPVARGVLVSPDRRSLMLGTKSDSGWTYRKLALRHSLLQ